jgi:LysM repeat protein
MRALTGTSEEEAMKRSARVRALFIGLAVLLLLFVSIAAVRADVSHTVRQGETLFSIGRLYGVNTYTISAANGMANPNYIRVGQVLTIPSAGGVAASGASYRTAGGVRYHTAGSGETLFSISRLYGVSPHSIAAANGLTNPNYVRRGQVLTIPSQAGWPYYGQWPGATTTTPAPAPTTAVAAAVAPTPTPKPTPNPCIPEQYAWNFRDRQVCVVYCVANARRDQEGNVVLGSHIPNDDSFVTKIFATSHLDGCWPQPAEVWFGNKTIRVSGMIGYDRGSNSPQIVVDSCNSIQIVQ